MEQHQRTIEDINNEVLEKYKVTDNEIWDYYMAGFAFESPLKTYKKYENITNPILLKAHDIGKVDFTVGHNVPWLTKYIDNRSKDTILLEIKKLVLNIK